MNIVLFRNDLRTHDHKALEAALMVNKEVAAIHFMNTPLLTTYGWGQNRIDWQKANLQTLRNDLKSQHNINLIIEEVPENCSEAKFITDTCMNLNPEFVFAGQEFGLNERRRDESLKTMFKAQNVVFEIYDTETVLPLHGIKNKSNLPYKIYTPFRKVWDANYSDTDVNTVDIAMDPKFDSEQANKYQWNPGTQSALSRLKKFITEDIANYHEARDLPDLNGTSAISPWLAVGAISPSMCLAPLINLYGKDIDDWPKGPQVWRQEIVWREFYRYIMLHFDCVSMNKPLQDWTNHVPWNEDKTLFQKWCDGETGVEFVDAAMKQLNTTGWMHNRLRMVTAMFLTKNLLIDWRLGERYFANKLFDYDFASNNGGWQWAASTGTDAAPYFRIFNPDTQAERFDADGAFRNTWLNEALRPEPIVNLKESRLNAIASFKNAKERFANQN